MIASLSSARRTVVTPSSQALRTPPEESMGTAIERGGDAAPAQIRQRIAMRALETGHVNIVWDAGAIRCRVVGTEHIHFWPQAERGFGP
jgi:hypothetical protein